MTAFEDDIEKWLAALKKKRGPNAYMAGFEASHVIFDEPFMTEEEIRQQVGMAKKGDNPKLLRAPGKNPPQGVPSWLKRDVVTETAVLRERVDQLQMDVGKLIDLHQKVLDEVTMLKSRVNVHDTMLGAIPASPGTAFEALQKLVHELDDRVNWLET